MIPKKVLLLMCLASLGAHGADQPGAQQHAAARVQALLPQIDKMYVELAHKEHLPALVYGVVVDGKLIHSRALGFANVEEKIAATTSTQFRIASMTKSFVAMAALKLRDQGKLRLDDPVAQYLPEFRKVKLPTSDSPPLTIRMLMTMTTGLPEDNPWGDRQMALGNPALEKFVGAGLSFSSAPGDTFEYSNLGYVTLGKVVSKVAGMRFQDYITRHILVPLGMHNTSWEYAKVAPAQLALGYRWSGSAWEREPILHDGDAAAMGGLITTAEDFARYIGLHLSAWPARDGLDGGPLRRASLREMQLPKVFTGFNTKTTLVDDKTLNPKVSFYGYGLSALRDSVDVVTVGHSGGLPGYGSQFRFAPDHGIGVFAFSNLRYAPVYAPTAKVLATLLETGKLTAREVTPSAILLQRQQQVARLVQDWDEQLGRDITADNFFLDRSRADWVKEAGVQFAKIGTVLSVGVITAENRLRGTFPVVGEQGTLKVSFTLTPENDPKVQEVELALAAPGKAQ
ncbi:MAG: serine hydrolase domain-containing protein [Telluria sp.]